MVDLAIKNVCVIGAGTMGGGIAAHLANLGFQVTLLDADQNAALNGLDRARQARPPIFYLPERAGEIRVGNTKDHLHLAANADWICEAIVERADAKQSLFALLDEVVRPDTVITTNTSGLQIGVLAEGRSESFQHRFFGAHFFNPPRYLRLLELIPTPQVDQALVESATEFFQRRVARRVVVAKDTPGFIANRFGMWSMFHAIRVAEHLHLAVEDVDAITGPFLGRPTTGSFRLNDLVGLDVMRDIASNLLERCTLDPEIKTLELPASMFSLLARGWLGDKTGHGYYRKEGRDVLALDLNTFAYRIKREAELPGLTELGNLPLTERIGKALDLKDEVGEFLREYLLPTLRYANAIKEEIGHSVVDIDRVMSWGFGWELGPFQTIDALGAERVGIKPGDSFYKKDTYRSFSGRYTKLKQDPDFRPLSEFPELSHGSGYVIRDLDDGVLSIGFTTKMGVITPSLVSELTELLQHRVERFVLTSEAKSYSAGFDLNFLATCIDGQNLGAIEQALFDLQSLGELLSTKPCVAAVFGHCLGAGLELALSCKTIVAAAETNIGLPESRVGLIPGGRGVALIRALNGHSAKRVCEVSVTMTEGTIAANADHARQLGYLRPTDVTAYNPDCLIAVAKQEALHATPNGIPVWNEVAGPLVGMIDRALTELRASGAFSEYDEIIGGKICQITAKCQSYEEAIQRERKEFVDLCGRNLTHARIRHMLQSNRPLRN